ncbi:sensor histidine kinase [Pseudomonas sp. CFBP 8772]|nr:sensor histidine kinase [Pseudomonas sp. CFBP 8772]
MASFAMHGSRKLRGVHRMNPGSMIRWAALLGLATTGCNVVAYLASGALPLGLALINGLAFAGLCYSLTRPNRTIQFQPRELAEHMLQVQETERHRLSRELHDDIGQMLTAAKMQSDWLQRRAPQALHAQCTTLINTLDETLAKVRDVSAILNPRQLTSLGLEASLRAHLLRTLSATSVQWSLECQQRLDGIPEEIAVAAFRITQEAVTNMLRHAQAKNLRVQLQRRPEGLSVSIRDDGLGFAPALSPAGQGQRGMAGMAERASLLGGELSVASEPGQGTSIQALFPWAPRVRGRANGSKP